MSEQSSGWVTDSFQRAMRIALKVLMAAFWTWLALGVEWAWSEPASDEVKAILFVGCMIVLWLDDD